ncbi:MAG: S8 family serine peptidase [Caulobacteraceae bacterium]
MNRLLAAVALGLGLVVAPASAQLGGLGLPNVPNVPTVPSPGGVIGDLPNANDALDTSALRDVRELRERDLLRRHRRVLEPDPDGHPIVRSQILALAASEAALTAARAAGFTIVSSEDLGEFGALTVLRAPAGLSTRGALRLLQEADPAGVFDFDHLHIESGPLAPVVTAATNAASASGVRVGVIDSGVADHPAFDGAIAAQRGFAGNLVIEGAHGAAVCSLIRSAAPSARLYVADIYGGQPTGGTSSAMTRALSWLGGERTLVINISLVGPRNRIVEAAVAHMVGRGFLIVAAVGNDGPAAPPLYPAAYPGVVGVTGVDQRGRVLVEAGRGEQVDFAALGIVQAAAPRGGYVTVRGTSYASPIVAGLLAANAGQPSGQNAARAQAALTQQARDLGRRGRDDVYGAGLVSPPASAVASR